MLCRPSFLNGSSTISLRLMSMGIGSHVVFESSLRHDTFVWDCTWACGAVFSWHVGLLIHFTLHACLLVFVWLFIRTETDGADFLVLGFVVGWCGRKQRSWQSLRLNVVVLSNWCNAGYTNHVPVWLLPGETNSIVGAAVIICFDCAEKKHLPSD